MQEGTHYFCQHLDTYQFFKHFFTFRKIYPLFCTYLAHSVFTGSNNPKNKMCISGRHFFYKIASFLSIFSPILLELIAQIDFLLCWPLLYLLKLYMLYCKHDEQWRQIIALYCFYGDSIHFLNSIVQISS